MKTQFHVTGGLGTYKHSERGHWQQRNQNTVLSKKKKKKSFHQNESDCQGKEKAFPLVLSFGHGTVTGLWDNAGVSVALPLPLGEEGWGTSGAHLGHRASTHQGVETTTCTSASLSGAFDAGNISGNLDFTAHSSDACLPPGKHPVPPWCGGAQRAPS